MDKFCVECGKKLENESKICPNCGAKTYEEIFLEDSALYENTNDKATNLVDTNVNKKSNNMAIIGFVTSLIFPFFCGYASFLGLIFSIIGLVNANKNDGEGEGFAISGIVISSVLIIMIILSIIFGIVISHTTKDASSNLKLPTY